MASNFGEGTLFQEKTKVAFWLTLIKLLSLYKATFVVKSPLKRKLQLV